MLTLFRAAVAHDLSAMERDAPPVLQLRIAEWRAKGESNRIITLLAKTEVLNDSMLAHVPDLLTLEIRESVLDKKPSLIALFAKLSVRYPRDTVIKAMARAVPLREAQILPLVRNVDDLVLQLTNRDDRKKR